RILFPNANLQIGKRLVVLELDVKARLDVFNKSRFQEQGIDLGFGGQEVDVRDDLYQVGDAEVFRGPLVEVMRCAIAQGFRLADIDHAPLPVLHQIDAGPGRKLLYLLCRRDETGVARRYRTRHDTPGSTTPSCGVAFCLESPSSFYSR